MQQNCKSTGKIEYNLQNDTSNIISLKKGILLQYIQLLVYKKIAPSIDYCDSNISLNHYARCCDLRKFRFSQALFI